MVERVTTAAETGTTAAAGAGRYLPIADHGVIGDLHTVALVGTDGTIDWYCCAALRLAERLRLDPRRRPRRLLPDRAGCAGLDGEAALLPGHERADHALPLRGRRGRGAGLHADRPHGGASGTGTGSIRRVLGVRGEMRFRRRGASRGSTTAAPSTTRTSSRARRRLPTPPALSPRARSGSRRSSAPSGGVRAEFTPHAQGQAPRSSSRALEPDDAPAALLRGARPRSLFDRDGRVLAALARPLALHGPLARDGAPLGAHAQAADLRADRRDRRRADDEPARADRRRAQLGLPLHVDPRRRLLALRAPAARLHRGGGGLHGLARPTASASGDGSGDGPLQIMYGDRRPRRPPGVRARPPRGLPRLGAGAGRQRRPRTSSSSTSTAS